MVAWCFRLVLFGLFFWFQGKLLFFLQTLSLGPFGRWDCMNNKNSQRLDRGEPTALVVVLQSLFSNFSHWAAELAVNLANFTRNLPIQPVSEQVAWLRTHVSPESSLINRGETLSAIDIQKLTYKAPFICTNDYSRSLRTKFNLPNYLDCLN